MKPYCYDNVTLQPLGEFTVQHHPLVYLVFWGPSWTPSDPIVTALQALFSGLGGTAYNGVLSQYYSVPDGVNVANTVQYGGTGWDTSTPPASISLMSVVGQVADNALFSHFEWSNTPDTQIIVVTQPHTASDGLACGAHGHTNFVAFAFVPNNPDTQSASSCWPNTPGVDQTANVTANVAHEYAETVLRPNNAAPTGWEGAICMSDTSCETTQEIADLCKYVAYLNGVGVSYLFDNARGGCYAPGTSSSPGGGSPNLVQNGGFNSGTSSWARQPSTNWQTYGPGQTGNDPYEGTSFLATNTSAAGGGISQQIPRTINAGDSYCASARVVTQGLSGGASGLMALFMLGNSQEVGSQSFSHLPGGNGWTLIQTCVTATRSHTNLQIQFYPTVNGTHTLAIDAVGVYRNLAQNGGFNNGNFNYWARSANTNWALYGAGQFGNNPYEGSGFAATNTSQTGGAVYQQIPQAISTGQTFCASAQVVTQGTVAGAGGLFALFLLNNTQEVASQSFSNLPGGTAWTPVQTCITASRSHTDLMVAFYPNVNDPKTLAIDAVGVHPN